MELSGLEQGLLYTALGIHAAATFVVAGVIAGRRESRSLRGMLFAGVGVLTGLLIALWVTSGQFPVGTRPELLLLGAWTLAVAGAILFERLNHPVLLLVTAPTVGLLCLFAWLLALRPDLGSRDALHPGVVVHILLAVFGLAAFTFAAGVAAYYLWQIRALKRDPKIALGRDMPPLEVLDRLHFGATALGFPLLFMSVFGATLFSERARDDLWTLFLDPTVLVTLVGLLIYLALFGARALLGWRGRRIAILSVAGFVIMVVGFVVAAFCTSPDPFHLT
jgi:ABC-type uncharacterized transport system permease subunit